MNNFSKTYLIKKIYFSLFLSIVILSHQGFCAASDYILPLAEKHFTNSICCVEGFCAVDERWIENFGKRDVTREEVAKPFKSALQKKIDGEASKGKNIIIAVKGSRIPLGFNEGDGEAETKETVEDRDVKVAEDRVYRSIDAKELFGEDIITTYAAKGYTFWSRNPMKADDAKQAENRINFQQAIGARYVWGRDIEEGGILPAATDAEAVLNTLTPHVVFSTANLSDQAIRTRIEAFFYRANKAVWPGISPAGREKEWDEAKLLHESVAKAVAVIDLQPNSVKDSPEVRLGLKHSYIRRLIVTTTAPIEPGLKIGDEFLFGCNELTSLEFRGLESVTTIGDKFLGGCTGLLSLELRGFENVTTVGNYFLSSCTGLQSLDLRGFENVTTIGNFFLVNCTALLSLDLSPLMNVKAIGNYFLLRCSSLDSLDLSPLMNVTTIGNYFLYDCPHLDPLELRGIDYVKKIQLNNIFAQNIRGTEDFHILDIRQIENIANEKQWELIKGEAWNILNSLLQRMPDKIMPNSSILAVKGDISPLGHEEAETKGKVEELDVKEAQDTGHPALRGYHSIDPVVLFGDNIITSYAAQGYTFWTRNPMKADGAKQAENRINFQQAIGARYVWGTDIQEGGILPDATGPEAVLNTLTPHVVFSTADLRNDPISRNINAFFDAANTRARGPGGASEEEILAAESKVNAIAVIDVEAVETASGHELKLSSSNLSKIRRLIVTTTAPIEPGLKIGNEFLSSCTELTSLEFRGFEKVTTIGDDFLIICNGLTSIDLSGLRNVTTIGNGFLCLCIRLQSLNLRGLENVKTIGNSFLCRCARLKSLDLSPLIKVTTIGNYFLGDCTGLTSLNLRGLENITTIGDNFLANTSPQIISIKSAIEARPEPTLAEKVKGYIEIR